MEFNHGCRAEYGPLDLRIQTSASYSGFIGYVEDARQDKSIVCEQMVPSALESAKDYVALRAHELLEQF